MSQAQGEGHDLFCKASRLDSLPRFMHMRKPPHMQELCDRVPIRAVLAATPFIYWRQWVVRARRLCSAYRYINRALKQGATCCELC